MSWSVVDSEIASSSASLVPDPIVKCVVCAASPISTTSSVCHFSFVTVLKLSHDAPPLLFRLWPWRCRSKTVSRRWMQSASSSVSKPSPVHVSGEHSAMNVLVLPSKP